MISQIIWFQDSPTAFDVTLIGIGGDDPRFAGCTVPLDPPTKSPSGLWQLKCSDQARLYRDEKNPYNRIAYDHGSSCICALQSPSVQFNFTGYPNFKPNVPGLLGSENQTGPVPVAGWNTYQSMTIISQLDPHDPSTWTWVLNYSGNLVSNSHLSSPSNVRTGIG